MAVALIVSATAAFGAVKEGSFSLTPVIGGYVYDDDQHTDTSLVLGVRAGYNITKAFGVEALYDYVTPSDASSGPFSKVVINRFGGQALYHFFPDNVLVPYLAAGYYGVNFNSPKNDKTYGAFDYGAGVKYFLADNFALRGDVRHILYKFDSRTNDNVEFTLGAYVQFGAIAPPVKAIEPEPVKEIAEPAPIPPVDSDGDGVIDTLDKCPGTPAGASVDNYGCPPVVEKVIIRASEKEVIAVVAPETKVIVLVFEDIHFNFDQSTLTPEAKIILKRDILLLKENPKTKIRVAGYTSASGTEEYNQKLSERRAKAVQEYLVSEGIIKRDRLVTIGYGETHPAVHEAAPKDLYSDEAKANMRVLFEVIIE